MLNQLLIGVCLVVRACFVRVFLICVALFSAGNAGSAGSEDPISSYVSTYTYLVYENYVDSWAGVQLLEEAVKQLLAEPTHKSLEDARAAWLSSRESYGQTEAFRFYGGPIDYFDAEAGLEGPEGRMNAWPVDEAYIDYVAGDPSAGIINDVTISLTLDGILSRNQIDDDSNVSTGYHAVEFLLWGQDTSRETAGTRPITDFVAGSLVNDRRRLYIKLIVSQLVRDHEFLVKEWAPGQDNYAREFENLSPREALGKILVGALTLIEFELASERLGVALDSGDPEDEHSCFSDNTHNDFIYNARGIENVYFGRYSTYQGIGLDNLVQDIDPDLNEEMKLAIMQTGSLLEGIEAPFDRVLSSPSGSPKRLQSELAFDSLMRQGRLLKEVGFLFGLDIHSNDGGLG
jgi:putative iron-regulated protein